MGEALHHAAVAAAIECAQTPDCVVTEMWDRSLNCFHDTWLLAASG
jgi:hypothetical protein